MMTTTTILFLLTHMAANAVTSHNTNPLLQLNKKQLHDFKEAYNKMDIEQQKNLFDLEHALARCKQERQDAQDNVNKARDNVQCREKYYIGLSAGANIYGDTTGVLGDLALACKFTYDATNIYNETLDFKGVVNGMKTDNNIQQFFEDVKSSLKGEASSDDRVCDQLDDKKKEVVAHFVEALIHKVISKVSHSLVERTVRKNIASRAFLIAEEQTFHSLNPEAEAEREAVHNLITKFSNQFGRTVTAEVAKDEELKVIRRGAEEVWSWVPVLGQVVTGAIGGYMMKDTIEQINSEFHAEYMEGINMFFDCAEEELRQEKQTFHQLVRSWLEEGESLVKQAEEAIVKKGQE